MLKNNKFQCHCGDWRFKNAFFVVDEVREKVCRDLLFYGEVDGKQYCVLHYPSKDKVEDFELVFQERIKEDSWDFRMVYFPKNLKYENEEFNKTADFGHATFADGIDARYCKFNASFVFFDSIFLEEAFFTYSHFHGQVNFNAADFRDYGYFAGVTFHTESYPSFNNTKFKKAIFSGAKFEKPDYGRKAEFTKSTFSETIDFSNAEFFYDADFKDAKFPESGKTDFESVIFHNGVSFENVEFFDGDFKRAKFCYQKKSFDKTIFKYCKFQKSISFVSAEFYQQTDFEKSTFQNAHFESAVFAGSANFREAQFSEDVFFNDAKFGYKRENRITSVQVNFDGAGFGSDSRVFFDNTWFSWHTSFNYVKFDGYILFKGTSENPVFDYVFEEHAFWGLLDFTYTTIEKPEKVYFQTVRLRPSWFVNSVFDLRKVNLIDIDWGNGNSSSFSIEDELKVLEKRIKHNSKKLLTVTFRQIAENAESNNRFDEASNFRQIALRTEWIEKKEKISNWINNLVPESEKLKRRFGGSDKEEDKPIPPTNSFGILRRSGDFFIHGLYRITSFYGESWSWALGILLSLILVIFPIIYTQINFQTCSKDRPIATSLTVCESKDEEIRKNCTCSTDQITFTDAIVQSLTTATLQNVEYRKPLTVWGELWIILEKIFAPLQAALLALAIRRKFMR